MALVVDTGVLLAFLDDRDPYHAACFSLLSDAQEGLILPAAVLVEFDYMFRKVAPLERWVTFSEDVSAGAYFIHPLSSSLLLRAARLQAKYADLRLGVVDASVFATCEELNETRVATLDRRHFSVLRTEDGRALEIVPELD